MYAHFNICVHGFLFTGAFVKASRQADVYQFPLHVVLVAKPGNANALEPAVDPGHPGVVSSLHRF